MSIDQSQYQGIISEIGKLGAKIDQMDTRLKDFEGRLGPIQPVIQEKAQPTLQEKAQPSATKIPILNEAQEQFLKGFISANDGSVTWSLVYHPKPGQDKGATAASICFDKNPLLLLIETTDGRKFGGYRDTLYTTYFTERAQTAYKVKTWNAFTFSIDKNRTDATETPWEPDYYPHSFCRWLNLFWFPGDDFLSKQWVDPRAKKNKDGVWIEFDAEEEDEDNKERKLNLTQLYSGKNHYTVKDLYVYQVNL